MSKVPHTDSVEKALQFHLRSASHNIDAARIAASYARPITTPIEYANRVRQDLDEALSLFNIGWRGSGHGRRQPVTITVSRKTAELVRMMMPMPSLLNLSAVAAGLEFGEAVDRALGRDMRAGAGVEEEEEPEYAPPR